MASYIFMNYRQIYKQYYGSIPTDNNGRTYDIHHIDGDRTNNDITNLIAIPVEEHLAIHKKQKDYGACLRIAAKLNFSQQELSNFAKLHSKQQVYNGTHNFLGGAIQSATQKRLLESGTHNFQGSGINNSMLADGIHSSQIQWSCLCCRQSGKGSTNFKRWHGNQCKLKIIGY